jgi:hypothetical protein
MDPLSIATNMLTVLQISGCVVRYLFDMKNASRECQKALMEVNNARAILFQLRELVLHVEADDPWFTMLKMLCGPHGAIDHFRTTIEAMEAMLGPVHGRKKLQRSLTWTFRKGELTENIYQIERQKLLFNLVLQNDHMFVITSILLFEPKS